MVYVGVDIAKVDHMVGAVDERGERVCRPMAFKNSEAGFARLESWLDGVAGHGGDRPLLDGLLCVSHLKGPLGRRGQPDAGKSRA